MVFSTALTLGKILWLVLPPAAYFSARAEKSRQKLLLSVFSKPVPRHVGPLLASIGAGYRPVATYAERRFAPPVIGWRGFLRLYKRGAETFRASRSFWLCLYASLHRTRNARPYKACAGFRCQRRARIGSPLQVFLKTESFDTKRGCLIKRQP